MNRNKYSRREFLRRFAILSSSSLLIGLMSGCGPPDSSALNVPLPVENEHPVVNSIYFTDSQATRIVLQNNVNVPVQVVFLIDFSKSMNTAAPIKIRFTDSAGNAVPFSKSWANDLTLTITPLSQLLFGTTYTLSVRDAQDAFGNNIVLTADAGATFKTISA